MNNSVLGAEELKALSPQEREYALKILEELQTTGNSKLFEDLVYADYKEIPTDIVTFIKDTQYLGKAWHLPDGKCKLFPFWENKLKELFPDNIHTNYNTFIESGARGLGKAQPLSSLVLTPNGYVPMSQIKVGSDVVGVDGNSYKVSEVFPQGDRDIYQFTFEDGTICECADNHLWEVYDKITTKTEVMTTLELLESGITYPNGKKSRYSIPVCSPIKMSSLDLWLDPYVLGVIFECGCLYDDKVIIALSNEQIAKNISKILSAEKYKLKKCPQGYEIYTKDKCNKYYDFVISNDINLSAVFKRIPQCLKVNDIYTRQSILSGILDVDGRVNRLTKFIELSTLNKQYAEDVAWIVRSLGGICTIEERNIKSLQFKSRDAVNIETYELYIKLPKGINTFRFVDVELDSSFVPPAHKDIDKIEYIGHEECQCIIVNYDRHLYITDGFNVTHNSEIAVTVGLYLMHRLMCLKNPYQTLNLKPTEQVAFAFMNITKGLAENIGVTKFQNTVQSSPWFMSRGTITGRTNLMWNPPEFINLIVGSQSSDVIGQAIYYCFFDEISFIKNMDVEMQKKKAIDMIDTAVGGMKTRFTNKGKNPTLLVLASSKRSEKSFLEEHIKKKAETDNLGTLIVDEPVWNVRPASEYSGKRFWVALGNRFLNSEVLPEDITSVELEIWQGKGYKLISVPIEYLANFKEDIDRALCDFAGISSSELTTYISGVRLMDCVNKEIENPFTKEIIDVGNSSSDTAQYYDFFDISKVPKELMTRPLYIHMDMSISGDKTGIAGVWIVGKKPPEEGQPASKELFFRLAFSVSVRAPKGQQISFEKNRQFIYWLKEKGFNIKGITTDTFQSCDTGQSLKAKNYNYDVLSVDRVSPDHICHPYQYFKSTIYDKRIEMFQDHLLIEEITGLERNSSTGKVDHSPNSINCLSGDTLVSLVDGRELSIENIVSEFNTGKENFVYTVNEQSGKIEAKKILNAFCSGSVARLIKITLDNGETILCTPEHRIMLRNGVYCEAKDLLVDDSLMPLYRKISGGRMHGYRLYYEPFEDCWHYEHRKFATEILDEKYLVHHKDCVKTNNNPTNLIWMSKSAHVGIHAKLQTGAQSANARKKRSLSVKKYHDEGKKTTDYWTRYHKDLSPEEAYNFHIETERKNAEYKSRVSDLLGINNYDELSRREKSVVSGKLVALSQGYSLGTSDKLQKKHIEVQNYFNVNYEDLSEHERRSLSIRYARAADPTYQQKVSEAVSKNHSLGKYINASNALKQCNEKKRMLKQLFPKIDNEKFIEFFGISYSDIPSNKKCVWVNRYREKMYDILNHKVTKIETIILDSAVPVYDLTIEDNPNFALSCGVFVHNSKDKSDAVCGAVYNASLHADEYAFDFGEDLDPIKDVSNIVTNDSKKRTQLNIDFEQELNKMLDPLARNGIATKENTIQQIDAPVFYYGDGIIVW